MEAIFPISALQKDAAAVRREAQADIVRLTENGRGAYIFATEEVFEEYVRRQREEAAFEARLLEGVERGEAAYRAGDYLPMDEAVKKIREDRAKRAAG